jgi:hypothetical protein
MTATLPKKSAAWLALATCVVTFSASAATIYDNSAASSDLGTRFNPGLFEIGDEIILGGPERYLTDFRFGYWALNNGTEAGSFTGIDVRVRFYLNDGPEFNGYATPSSTFFDSGWLDAFITIPTNRGTIVFTSSDFGGGLFMPVTSNFTWSVQFRDMDVDDTIGVDLFSPPTVGQAINDYWQYNGTSWSLLTNTVPMNFAARLEATVPEPSVVVLAILGGVGFLLMGRRLRRS